MILNLPIGKNIQNFLGHSEFLHKHQQSITTSYRITFNSHQHYLSIYHVIHIDLPGGRRINPFLPNHGLNYDYEIMTMTHYDYHRLSLSLTIRSLFVCWIATQPSQRFISVQSKSSAINCLLIIRQPSNNQISRIVFIVSRWIYQQARGMGRGSRVIDC